MSTDTQSKSAEPTAARVATDPELIALYRRVGDQLAFLRMTAGLSQRDVCAELFGKPERQGEWSRWERGLILPNIATLYQIAKYFGISLAALGLYEPEQQVSHTELEQAREHLAKALELLGG